MSYTRPNKRINIDPVAVTDIAASVVSDQLSTQNYVTASDVTNIVSSQNYVTATDVSGIVTSQNYVTATDVSGMCLSAHKMAARVPNFAAANFCYTVLGELSKLRNTELGDSTELSHYLTIHCRLRNTHDCYIPRCHSELGNSYRTT
jgi:hypothetical protein